MSTDLAYLAGIVDADGFIGVQRSVKAGRVYFGARVGITGIRREPHDLAVAIFGGNVTVARSRECVSFVWSRYGSHCVEIVQALAPYLRVKREQALLAVALHEQKDIGACLWPFDHHGEQKEIFLAVRGLNVRAG